MAWFMVSFAEYPDWINDFRTNLDGVSEKSLKSIRAEIYTSVGHTELVVPEKPFLDRLKDSIYGSKDV